jgi:hypothetical protein
MQLLLFCGELEDIKASKKWAQTKRKILFWAGLATK